MDSIIIEPIQPSHIQAARDILVDNAFTFQLVSCQSKEEAEEILNDRKELNDLHNVQELYFNNRGIFLIALEGQKVIGMGAIKYFSNDICELRRMFFAKEYQGKGFGKRMAQILLEHAKTLSYKKIRLWVYNPEKQIAAVCLYRKLGFYEIEPYVVCKGKLFMEKEL